MVGVEEKKKKKKRRGESGDVSGESSDEEQATPSWSHEVKKPMTEFEKLQVCHFLSLVAVA